MAKALFGYVSPSQDARLLEEVSRLRRRVQELEQELSTTQAEKFRQAERIRPGHVDDDELIRLSEFEHAGI